ncbi:hypothetical protein D3C71_1479120 [compost metagenome]
MVVALHDSALLVTSVAAVFVEPVQAGLEYLEAASREALPHVVDAALDSVVGWLDVQAQVGVCHHQLLAVLLAAATGSRIDGPGYPLAPGLDAGRMNGWLSLAAIVL